MGFFSFILSAFKFRKKETTKEKLQHIDEELDRLDTSTRRNQQLQKSAVLYLIIISILIYCCAIIIFYLWYLPTRWSQRLLYSIPFLVFPFLIFFLKKILHKIFINRISTNANAVKELKKDKKKILETVMDTETYKVAKELLQKYDPHRSLVEESESPVKQSPKPSSEGQELRRRNIPSLPPDAASKQVRPVPHTSTNGYPVAPVMVQRSPAVGNGSPMRSPAPMGRGVGPRVPVPIAPILPRERTVFDKVCDFVIGDGPTNRFALICKQCCGHNGMVLVEEFKFTSYRCCYCGFFNPARKQRLNAPKLEKKQQASRSTASDSANSTDAEGSNKVDDNEDKENVLEEEDITQIENTIQNGNTEETTGDTNPVVEEKTDDVETNVTNTVSNEVIEDSCSETDKTSEER